MTNLVVLHRNVNDRGGRGIWLLPCGNYSQMKKIESTEIEAGLRTLSRVVERYGDHYWPIFERLEHELALLTRRRRALSKYLNHEDFRN